MKNMICSVLAVARRTLDAAEVSPTDADILMASLLGKDRCYLLAYGDTALTKAQAQRFQTQIEQRCSGVPVAYLTGLRDFWCFALQVNQHTLIPRPETECLVEYALALGDAESRLRVLDLGTGSGAIALALAQERPHWQIMATDINPNTLAMAQQNAVRLHLTQIEFLCSDWLAAVEGHYDVIISNPPYIAESDPHMDALCFEPRQALVSGPDGLQAIRQITEQATGYLVPGGRLLMEHGYEQGVLCRALLEKQRFSQVFTRQDLAGLDRLSGGQWDRSVS